MFFCFLFCFVVFFCFVFWGRGLLFITFDTEYPRDWLEDSNTNFLYHIVWDTPTVTYNKPRPLTAWYIYITSGIYSHHQMRALHLLDNFLARPVWSKIVAPRWNGKYRIFSTFLDGSVSKKEILIWRLVKYIIKQTFWDISFVNFSFRTCRFIIFDLISFTFMACELLSVIQCQIHLRKYKQFFLKKTSV